MTPRPRTFHPRPDIPTLPGSDNLKGETAMRKSFILPASILALVLCCSAAAALAQAQTYTDADEGYALELPSPSWVVVRAPGGAHRHTGFVYSGGGDWRLHIRRVMVDRGETTAALADEEEMDLRFQPAYVETGRESFAGRLSGTRFTYEYSDGGRLMAGRTYYLQVNKQTIYILHFTGARDRLTALRGGTDFIARSFRPR